ncbi:MAG: N-acetylmuramoyl-L-alanine amidase [Scytonema sp. PMC 1069.18]|nr:N-acetylmuramoyl-L-alanine amidase [Scytonema sp. PMC 1069.18]MEC4883784.1 N-acetylmuramoyl-L-alanine amidase [Scytonema sp. PMC 1070.18]
MRLRVKTTGAILISLALAGLIMGLLLGKAEHITEKTTASQSEATVSRQYFDIPQEKTKTLSQPKATATPIPKSDTQPRRLTATPNLSNSESNTETDIRLKGLTTASNPNASVPSQNLENQRELEQSRAIAQNNPSFSVKTTAAFAAYKPRYEIAWADPSNYGERYAKDVNGMPVNLPPIIVLHETAAPASSAVNFFQTPHDDDNVQASYHTMIKLDGTVVYIVPPEKRAYGAANSVFETLKGLETVQTNPELPPSVNNFAYHIGLETPPSGLENNEPTHNGYTDAQYQSLAWLVAQSNVPDERITTHKAVDRSGQRIDPRSFEFNKFLTILHSFRVLELSANS